MKRLFAAWRTRPWLTSAFLMACAVTLFFAGRLVFFTAYWATHSEMPVEPWMTVGYVARSWGVEPRQLDAEAGLPLPEVKGHPQPLAEIARDRRVPVETVIAEVEAALDRMQAGSE
ncbi:hypothetical protein [Tabrizicola sp.]|uniref:hypothetical protein n=1 Tax=Tabrizicola sp. TaxID=2005166 RepID=UPI0025DB6D35|nr:hypothetical protein [Tabrizicola sp.]